ncbi:hypothetical protein MesoLj113b_33510 [Mesorhizobium sp. 113-3-3]|nr:hypothetical protein MesoLj113b_33510 [Mesorhizobium sp. 113-3-3]
MGWVRHGAAGVPVGSGAAEMVQHRHGRASGGDTVADAEIGSGLMDSSQMQIADLNLICSPLEIPTLEDKIIQLGLFGGV